jgi:hypothetical protein
MKTRLFVNLLAVCCLTGWNSVLSQVPSLPGRNAPTLQVILKKHGLADEPSAEELGKVFRDDKGSFISGEIDSSNFYTLEAFCQLLLKTERGSDMVDQLIPEISSCVPDFRNEIDNWGQAAIRSSGGEMGLLMNCVLDLAGVEGLDKIYQILLKNGDFSRMRILFEKSVPARLADVKFREYLEARLGEGSDVRAGELIKRSFEIAKVLADQKDVSPAQKAD